MQDNLPLPQSFTWREVYPYLILTLLTASPAYIKIWWDRKKSRSEQHKTDAETGKVIQETRSLAVRDTLEVGNAMMQMLQELREMQEANDLLRQKMMRYELMEIQAKMDAYQVKRLKGILDAHGISFSEADHPHH